MDDDAPDSSPTLVMSAEELDVILHIDAAFEKREDRFTRPTTQFQAIQIPSKG